MSSLSNSLIQIPKNGYRGQIIEPASGLYFMGNGVRVYSTKLRQFYSRDPQTPFNGGNINRYQYAELDPINLWDITGFSSETVVPEPAEKFRVEMDLVGVVLPPLIALGWFLITLLPMLFTGGAALPAILSCIGFLLCCIASALRLIMTKIDDGPMKKALEVTALVLDIVGNLIAFAATAIGAIATKTGTWAAKLCQKFATQTRIGRFVGRRTAQYVGTTSRVSTPAISRAASREAIPINSLRTRHEPVLSFSKVTAIDIPPETMSMAGSLTGRANSSISINSLSSNSSTIMNSLSSNSLTSSSRLSSMSMSTSTSSLSLSSLNSSNSYFKDFFSLLPVIL